MISRFFIHHPVFASVISLVITFAGLVAMHNLPIEQFPNITPPLISVSTNFNGANAEVMANDVASPMEQQILGVEDMIYMYSQNSSTGQMVLDVFFEIGTNANMAQVNVQNKISQAMAQLPEAVQKEGVIVNKQLPNILMTVAIQAPTGQYDSTFVSNFAQINVVNELDLVPGISNIKSFGQRNYAMRIWLRPDLMAQMEISPQDIVHAISQQNKDYGLGQLGQAPNVHPVPLTVPFASQGRLSTPEEFGNIVLRADIGGAMVLLKDVAEVTLGAQDYSQDATLNGKDAVVLGIFQEFGANALDVSNQVRAKMEQLTKNFPEGIEYSIPYDSTLFVRVSIAEVVRTIFEAAILVMLVVFLFLQKWRATMIPVMAIIVSIVGTFAGMYALGYSINTVTLFGIVLAIGIVVDDAIVVVENIERNMRLGLPTKEAALRAMDEVTAPVIAIVFVLCAVFIPVAFLGGIAGQLYRQFAITLAVSVTISGLVALTLSPAISALLLKESKEMKWAHLFNAFFDWVTRGYLYLTKKLLHAPVIGLSLFALLLASVVYLFYSTPLGFVPQEDQGYLFVITNMPDGASLERTERVSQQITEIARKQPGVELSMALTGFSLIDNLSRTTIGSNFIILNDWKRRKSRKLHADRILVDLQKELNTITDGEVIALNPPAIQGLGTVGGFEFWLENRGDGGSEALRAAIVQIVEKAKERKELSPLVSTAQFDNLQFYVDLDRYKAMMLGVPVSEVFQALQTLVGSVYVNNFNKYGRVYQVIVQAQPEYREKLSDLGDMYVRSGLGKMVPLKSLISIRYARGPNLVTRFNDYPGAEILGGAAPGYTSGQAIKAMEELAKEVLPSSIAYGWSGAAYQEIETGGSSLLVLSAALLMVFLILSALYEKWSVPLAILMAVPFGIFGAFVAISILHMPNDLYFQIGLVTLIALSAKNAILIVEFAIQKVQEGWAVADAALEAAKLRFRAIVMTSLTFIFGVIPLVFSQGAGAASRHSVGVGVMGGMLSATCLALFFVPLFFKLLYREKV
ncbi:MAG: efflux RND transporter permease subunit [Chlamydiales bacterium]|nr:efflux RND transporter permease subunit [Chlamydiales bacterium]